MVTACIGNGANPSLSRHCANAHVHIEAGRQGGTLLLDPSKSVLNLKTRHVSRHLRVSYVNLEPNGFPRPIASPTLSGRQAKPVVPCWYHRMFRPDAQKARQPCSFPGETPELAGKRSRNRRQTTPGWPSTLRVRPSHERQTSG